MKKKKHTSRHRYRYERHRREVRKKQIIGTALICLAAVILLGGFILYQQKKQQDMQVTAGNSHDVGNGYRNVTYNGEEYRYNNRITNVLYAGIDSTGKMQSTVQYGNKARADSIALVVMDEKHNKLTILPINRDTMTRIRRYSLSGNDNGLYTTHIGYAYSYGDGGKVSCENLCEAVSIMLGGIPVNRYVVTNQDSMPYINNMAGGITLTVPNDDLADQYPQFTSGALVTLDDTSVIPFLQYRNTQEDFSNEGRMERQKAYITAFIEKIKSLNNNQLEDAWNSLDTMEDYIQTSITRNQYLKLADLVKQLDFSQDSYEQLEGEDRQGELHDEFHLDEQALQQKILELFYDKI